MRYLVKDAHEQYAKHIQPFLEANSKKDELDFMGPVKYSLLKLAVYSRFDFPDCQHDELFSDLQRVFKSCEGKEWRRPLRVWVLECLSLLWERDPHWLLKSRSVIDFMFSPDSSLMEEL